MISAPSDEFNSENWWKSEAGFLFVLSEYLKFVYYGLRYGWLGPTILAAVVLFFFARAWFRRRRQQYPQGVERSRWAG